MCNKSANEAQGNHGFIAKKKKNFFFWLHLRKGIWILYESKNKKSFTRMTSQFSQKRLKRKSKKLLFLLQQVISSLMVVFILYWLSLSLFHSVSHNLENLTTQWQWLHVAYPFISCGIFERKLYCCVWLCLL